MFQMIDGNRLRLAAAGANLLAFAFFRAGRFLRHADFAPVMPQFRKSFRLFVTADRAKRFALSVLRTGRLDGDGHLAIFMRKHLDPSGYRLLAGRADAFLAPLLRAGRLSGDRPFLNLVRQLFGVSLFPVVALAAVTEIKTFQSTGRVSLGLPRAERMISGAFRQRRSRRQQQHTEHGQHAESHFFLHLWVLASFFCILSHFPFKLNPL